MNRLVIIILAVGCLILPCAADSNIALYQGWNFISVPVLHPEYQYPDYQVYSLFSTVDTQGHSTWRYNAGTGIWDKLYPDSTISPLDGIWIYSGNSKVIWVQGDNSRSPAPIQLYSGWNAIGFAGVGTPAYQAFSSLSGKWLMAFRYNNQFRQYDRTIFDSEPTRNIFAEPGNGYWVYLSGPGQYSLPPGNSPVTTPAPVQTTAPVTQPTTIPSTIPTTIPTTQPTVTPSPTPTGLQPGAHVSSSQVFGTNYMWYQYLLTINSGGTSMQADLKTEISSDSYMGTPAIHHNNTMVMPGMGMTTITDIYYDTTFSNILGGTITTIINGQTTVTAIPPGPLQNSGSNSTSFQRETTLTYQGTETVTVPAGTFTADKYTAITDNGSATYWVAPGVPVPVKYNIVSTGNGDTTAELEGWG
jgi:hypothetical protein